MHTRGEHANSSLCCEVTTTFLNQSNGNVWSSYLQNWNYWLEWNNNNKKSLLLKWKVTYFIAACLWKNPTENHYKSGIRVQTAEIPTIPRSASRYYSLWFRWSCSLCVVLRAKRRLHTAADMFLEVVLKRHFPEFITSYLNQDHTFLSSQNPGQEEVLETDRRRAKL